MRIKLFDRENPDNSKIITLDYENKHDHHVFKSKDMRGLFIATKDMNSALEQIAPCVASLAHHSDGKIYEIHMV